MSEKRKYRQFTPGQKAEIVLAGLRGDRSVRDVCREYEIAETLYYQWRVDRWPGPARAHHPRGQRLPQRLTRMITVPARQRTQLVENCLLPGPVPPSIPRRDRLRDRFALPHRQSHSTRVAQNRTVQRRRAGSGHS